MPFSHPYATTDLFVHRGQVNSEKSMKHVARFIASQVAELPGLDGTFKEPRQFDVWLPSKIIKSYNWRYCLNCFELEPCQKKQRILQYCCWRRPAM